MGRTINRTGSVRRNVLAARKPTAKIINKPADTRLVGYARVSTSEQKLDLQLDALRAAGVHADNLHVEKLSATSAKRRHLDLAIKDLREGDTLVVWRLDRLARSMRDLYRRLDQIHDAGAKFRSLTEDFDFGTATGKFVLGILGLVAELERKLTIQRTTAGMKAAAERGMIHGRPTKMTAAKIARAGSMLRRRIPAPTVAKRLKVATSSIYGYFTVRRTGGKVIVKRKVAV